ncbi:hypothetical protein ES703_102022 [subsurface metagenome]
MSGIAELYSRKTSYSLTQLTAFHLGLINSYSSRIFPHLPQSLLRAVLFLTQWPGFDTLRAGIQFFR